MPRTPQSPPLDLRAASAVIGWLSAAVADAYGTDFALYLLDQVGKALPAQRRR